NENPLQRADNPATLEATARHSAGGSVAFGITPGQQEDCPCDLVSGLGQKQCKGNPHEPVRRRRLQGNNVQPCQAGDNRDKANTRPCKCRGGRALLLLRTIHALGAVIPGGGYHCCDGTGPTFRSNPDGGGNG